MKKLLIPVIMILSLMFAACAEKPRQAAKTAGQGPVAVKTVVVAPVVWPEQYQAVGTVQARTGAVISAKVMGYVQSVNVRAGDIVRRGQSLVELDSRDLDAAYRRAAAVLSEAKSAAPEVESAIAAARANMELAEVTFRRMKDLFEKKSISNQEFDEVSTRLKAAQAGHQMALSRREQLQSKIVQAEEAVKGADIVRGYARIAAPFNARVTEKRVNPGDLTAPGAPLLTLEREGGYRLEASVEESRISQIQAGHRVSVVLDALDRTVESRVSEIVPSVDPASRAYIVKIDLPATAQLRSGMFGRAIFLMGSRQTLTVPAGAVTERGQLQSVMVADEGIARNRLVTLGGTSGDQRQVLSGLNAGEKVIYPVPAGLVDGAKVEVRP